MPHTIIRTRRRTLCIQIHPQKGVIIRAPKHLSDKRIENFLKEKYAWIAKTKAKLQAQTQKATPRTFTPGELFPYLGHPTLPKGHTRTEVIAWYKEKALSLLTERTLRKAQTLAEKTQSTIIPKSIRVRSYRSRWGTCHRDNSITYNWKIVMAPLPIVDYLICHELSHILHQNHGPAFKKTLSLLDPNFKAHQKYLRENRFAFEL